MKSNYILLSVIAVFLTTCECEELAPLDPELLQAPRQTVFTVEDVNIDEPFLAIRFTQPVDTSSISAATLIIDGASIVGSVQWFDQLELAFLELENYTRCVTIDANNSTECTIDIRLIGGPAGIRDVFGFGLDGDGDGIEGGDYEETLDFLVF